MICPAPGSGMACRRIGGRGSGGLPVDAVDILDQPVELVLRFIVVAAPDQPHVDRGVPAVGDDRQQDVVALLHAARALLDRRDPLGEDALVILEDLARRRGDELALPALQRGSFRY